MRFIPLILLFIVSASNASEYEKVLSQLTQESKEVAKSIINASQTSDNDKVKRYMLIKLLQSLSKLDEAITKCESESISHVIPAKELSKLNLSDSDVRSVVAYYYDKQSIECIGNDLYNEIAIQYSINAATQNDEQEIKHLLEEINILVFGSRYYSAELELEYKELSKKSRVKIEQSDVFKQPFDPIKSINQWEKLQIN